MSFRTEGVRLAAMLADDPCECDAWISIALCCERTHQFLVHAVRTQPRIAATATRTVAS